MSIPKNVMHFRKQRAQEIRRFADKLESYIGNGISVSLYKAVNQLNDENYIPPYRDEKGYEKIDSNFWGYSIENIELGITADRHLKPRELISAKASLSISIVSNYTDWEKIKDPFYELSFNVTIKGINPKSNDGAHYFGFHIDRHHESQASEEIHPVYHLQYNLNPRKDENFDYGGTLNMDSPRFLHYPVDLILGLTFLIGNFQPENYQKLIEDREVKKIIKEYQNSIWKPYYTVMANHWGGNGMAMEWDQNVICPYLL
ncbi:MAG: hypothetical protein ACEPOV_10345 [Hyphomicrobiales bacterium]